MGSERFDWGVSKTACRKWGLGILPNCFGSGSALSTAQANRESE